MHHPVTVLKFNIFGVALSLSSPEVKRMTCDQCMALMRLVSKPKLTQLSAARAHELHPAQVPLSLILYEYVLVLLSCWLGGTLSWCPLEKSMFT